MLIGFPTFFENLKNHFFNRQTYLLVTFWQMMILSLLSNIRDINETLFSN